MSGPTLESIRCLFCGGILCKYENYRFWTGDPDHPNAIEGLYSNWITNNIVAMQRPSTRLMQEFHLIDRFKELGITAIFNLQQADEHESCGDGLEPHTGFSYDPEHWIRRKIYYYNYGWPDMDVPDFELALQLVQVMAHALQNSGKIAVHCHAGLGRTGLAIACYMVYSLLAEPKDAIELIRQRRPLSIQTAKQQKFVADFKIYLTSLRMVYAVPNNLFPTLEAVRETEPITFQESIENQRLLLAGPEQRLLRNVPKIVFVLTSQIREILVLARIQSSPEYAANGNLQRWVSENPRTSSLSSGVDHSAMCERISEFKYRQEISHHCRRLMVAINTGRWELVHKEAQLLVLVDLLMHWIVLLKEPLISSELLNLIVYSSDTDLFTLLHKLDKETFWTLNCILDIFRYLPSAANVMDALYRIAILSTHHRSRKPLTIGGPNGGPSSPLLSGKVPKRTSSRRTESPLSSSPQSPPPAMWQGPPDTTTTAASAATTSNGNGKSEGLKRTGFGIPRVDSFDVGSGRDLSAWEVARFLKSVVDSCGVSDDGVKPQMRTEV